MSTHVIHFYRPITLDTVNQLKNCILKILTVPDVDKISILMSSEGGNLNAGFTAYNFLRELSIPFSITNIGTIESIAVPIFLSANERYASDNSRFLLHSFNWTFANGTVDYPRLIEAYESLKFDTTRYANIFKERTKTAENPIDIMSCLNGSAKVLDAASAISAGMIHSIITPESRISANDVQWWID